MKIAVIGFMGSGKSIVANGVSQKLGIESFEMDQMILSKSARSSIEEIFLKDGELAFRNMEMEVSRELMEVRSGIISTGGGVVMNQLNMLYLKKGGFVIYLRLDFEEVLNRVGECRDRPLLRDKKLAKKLYNLRCPLYEYYSDLRIEAGEMKTEERSVEAVVECVSRLEANTNCS